MDENKSIVRNHSVELINQAELKCTGVLNVDSYDEKEIVGKLENGNLVITGENLSIKNFSADNRLLNVDGKILSLKYMTKKEKGFLKKLFK